MQRHLTSRRRSPSPRMLRRLNRSAVLGLVRRDGVASPSAIAVALRISLPTVMRVLDDLIAEGLVAHDGFDEAARGRPPARIKFRGAAHAIVGVEAAQGRIYGAVTDLNGKVQAELTVPADDDGPANVERLIGLVERLIAAPRPPGQTVRGVGIGVPSIVRQPAGEVVLTLGLGWHNLPLRERLLARWEIPVFVENERNLAAIGEWEFGAGRGASSVVSLAIGPGAGAGIVIDGRLHAGRSNAAGELSWFLDDPLLSGRSFTHLGDKASLRFGGIAEAVTDELAALGLRHDAGEVVLDALVQPCAAQDLGAVGELIDYATMAVGSIAAFLDPEVIVLGGRLAQGGFLVETVLSRRLRGNVFDPPRLVIGDLGHRDVVLGAIRLVLEATTLDPFD